MKTEVLLSNLLWATVLFGIWKVIQPILSENCQSTDRNMCNVDTTTNVWKSKLLPLLLYFWNILFQFDPTMKSSSKEATEVPTRTHNICKKLHANLKKSNFVPWKKLSFQCGWWRRFRAAYAKLRNCRVGILKLISNILNGNCQSTDKNTCNVDITTNIRKIKLYLHL